MSGQNTGVKTLLRKKAPCIIWTHSMLHRQANTFREESEEIQTVFQTVIRVVNCVKK